MANPVYVVQYVLGYESTPLHYVDNDTALAICGNSVCQYSLSGGFNTHLMWGPGVGIQTSTLHPRQHWLAISEKGLQPSVHVHDIQNENKEVATLTDVAELEVLVLAFSRTSWRFVTASGEPDFRLVLWDLDPSKGSTKMIEGKMGSVVDFITFSPTTADRICVSGMGQLSIWTYEKNFHRTTFTCKTLFATPHQPYAHAWASTGEILYVGCVEGQVLSFNVEDLPSLPAAVPKANPQTGLMPENNQAAAKAAVVDTTPDFKLLITLSSAEKIVGLCVGQNHMVIVGISGCCHWLGFPVKVKKAKAVEVAMGGKGKRKGRPKKGEKVFESAADDEYEAVDLDDFRVVEELDLALSEVTSVQYRDDEGQLLLGSSNGSITTVKVNAQQLQLQLTKRHDDDSAAVSTEKLVSMQWQSSFHSGSILAMGSLSTGKLLVTCGKDGTVRVWMADRGKEMSRHVFQSPQTCICISQANPTSQYLQNIVATGSSSGNMWILKLEPTGRSNLVNQIKLHAGGLDQISFNESGSHVVVVSKLDARVFFLLNKSPEYDDLELLGFVIMNNPVLAHAWDHQASMDEEDLHIFLSLAHGEIVKLKEALLVSGATDGTLQIRSNVLDPMKPPQKVLDVHMYDFYKGGMRCLTVTNNMLYTGGAFGVMFACDLTEIGLRSSQLTKSEQPVRVFAPQEHTVDPAEPSVVECHDTSVETRYMLAGQPLRSEMKLRIQKLRQEFHEIYETNLTAPVLEKLTTSEMIVDIDLENELRVELERQVEAAREELCCVSSILKARDKAANNMEINQVRISDLNKDVLAGRIKEECWQIMSEPGIAVWPFGDGYEVWSFPMLAKPSFDMKMVKIAKFYRHIEMYEHHYMKRLQKELAKIAAQIAAEQAAKEAAELAAQKAEIDALNAAAFGPLPSDVDSDFDKGSQWSSRVSMVSQQSGAEALQIDAGDDQQGSRRESTTGPAVGEREERNMGDASSPTPAVAIPEELEDEEEDLEILDTAPIQTFLYDALELTTSRRKRIQRYLLSVQMQETKIDFNKKLSEARQTKISHISRITEMKSRILDLHKMLSQPGEYPWPKLNEVIDGMPNIFEVKKEEILVPKVLNKAERARAEELKLFEDQQERLRAGNNAAERALMDMMGGKLEKKLEVVAVEEEINRPAWMGGNPKKFTKEQHKEIKDFDLYLKSIKEEKEKKIRGQEAEQKKLRSDVDELCTSFNTEMANLFQQRLVDEARCTTIEETISRLCLSVEIQEFRDEWHEANMSKNMDRLKSLKAQSVNAVTDFKREVDVFREKYDAAVAEDKLQDKNFRKNFSDCGDVVNLLYKLFKRRPAKQTDEAEFPKKAVQQRPSIKSTPRTSQSPSRRGSMSVTVSATTEDAVDPFYERPQEVTPAQWDRLVDARSRKMLQEEEVAQLTTIMNNMGGFYADLTMADDVNRRKIEASLRALADFHDSRERRRKNLELNLNLKQGFVEAELNPLEGDYTEAALMARSLVEEFNNIVLHEAHTKINMLMAAKTYKAENHGVQWEIAKNHVRQQHIVEKIRALQLLRVTKATQQVIKTGEDPATASESLALEKRFDHNIKLQDHRMEDKDFIYGQITVKIEEIKQQNAKLLTQAQQLHLEHDFQNRLCSTGLAAQQKEAALDQRFQALYVMRQLKETVKEQRDQIQALQLEYMNTRGRILPSLQQATTTSYDFPLRALHSEIGREILKANKTYYQSIATKRRPTLSFGQP
ncbi:unnamed protein product [Sphagnum jensenii]|uniref:Cilia- and flagella-associated protein 43 n=1 Tax=Sphagnum jensenii TaxID=128206 RepID=A0ABP1AW44_9BRYO